MGKGENHRIKLLIRLGILVIIVYAFIMAIIMGNSNVEELSYDKVITCIQKNEVTKIEVSQDSHEIWVTLNDESRKRAVIPSMEEFSAFVSERIENGAEIEFIVGADVNSVTSILVSVVRIGSWLLVFSLIPLFMSRLMGGKYEVKPVASKVKFSDVAGIDEEKAQLEEIVEFLKNPKKYHSKGAKIPRGVLLNGAPGTGKTLLAKAVAGEAGVPFFQANGSSFDEKYVGVGASRVRELFIEAKKVAPSIIFIDEIDSVAQNRYSGKSYSEQTLNQLLAEMDGFNTDDNVIVIAATNHIDILDAALIRPGRFDRHVFVPMPDIVAREKILEVHARNKSFSDEVSLAEIARKTVGFSGADLESVLNEAAIYSVNHNEEVISKEAIDESIARVLVGLAKKNSAVSEEDRKLTAIHEAGHAIISAVIRPNVKNFGISIVPRGKAGGYNFFDESNVTYHRKKDLFNQIQVAYGGRIAEDILLGDISTGASNDIEQASNIAYQMITRFAMNGSLLTKISGASEFNEQLDSCKHEEVETILKKAYESAMSILLEYKDEVQNLATLLIEREYLSQEEFEAFVAESRIGK